MFHICVFFSCAHASTHLLSPRGTSAWAPAGAVLRSKAQRRCVQKEKQMTDKHCDFIYALPVPDTANDSCEGPR